MTEELLERAVVLLEGSSFDRELVATALWFLRRPGALATVFVGPVRGQYPLPAAIEAFLAAGVSVRTFRRTSDDVVAALVEREQPPLVVMGRPDLLARRTWSLPERLIRSAGVAVVPRAKPPVTVERVVLAHDGTSASEELVPLVAAVARRQEAELVLLQVAAAASKTQAAGAVALRPRRIPGTWSRTVARDGPLAAALDDACRTPVDLIALAGDASTRGALPRDVIARARCTVLVGNVPGGDR